MAVTLSRRTLPGAAALPHGNREVHRSVDRVRPKDCLHMTADRPQWFGTPPTSIETAIG